MSTKQRKLVSNILLVCTTLMALGLWYYGANMSEAVREQEHRNQAWMHVIDHSTAAIIVADPQGVIVKWNHGAEKLLGWTRVEAEGADLQLIMAPDRYEKHQAGFFNSGKRQQLLDGGVLQVNGYVVNKQGDVLSVDVRLTAVANGGELFVAQIVAKEEVIVKPEPMPPPPQMKYRPPNIMKFRKAP